MHSNQWTQIGFNPTLSSHFTNNVLRKEKENNYGSEQSCWQTQTLIFIDIIDIYICLIFLFHAHTRAELRARVLSEYLSVPYGYNCNSISYKIHSVKTLHNTKDLFWAFCTSYGKREVAKTWHTRSQMALGR